MNLFSSTNRSTQEKRSARGSSSPVALGLTEQSPNPDALAALTQNGRRKVVRRASLRADRLRPKEGLSIHELARASRLMSEVNDVAATVQRSLPALRSETDASAVDDSTLELGADPMLWTRTRESLPAVPAKPTHWARSPNWLMSIFF